MVNNNNNYTQRELITSFFKLEKPWPRENLGADCTHKIIHYKNKYHVKDFDPVSGLKSTYSVLICVRGLGLVKSLNFVRNCYIQLQNVCKMSPLPKHAMYNIVLQ